MTPRPSRVALLVAGLLLAFTAGAQESAPPPHDHAGHVQPTAPAEEKTPVDAPASTTPAPPATTGTDAAEVDDPVDHAAMGHGVPEQATPAEVDHAAMGHGVPEQTAPAEVDHAAMGHGAPEETAPAEVDHAAMGHGTPDRKPGEIDHAAMGHTQSRPSEAPITPIAPLTDADRAAAQAPASAHPAHDNTVQSHVLFNRLEGFDADEGQGVEWEGQAWVGTDLHKLWLRSEGERVDGRTGSADVEVLYGRAISPWWDLVAGIRHDFKPGPSQDFLAIGVMGLAPYKVEMEATGYLGTSGQVAARVEVEYETLLTNRWILQPLVELNFNGQDDERRGVGSGLSSAEAGVRLRYEVTRQFAPYVGIVGEWTFGRTADFRREEGEATHDTRVVAGLRIWF